MSTRGGRSTWQRVHLPTLGAAILASLVLTFAILEAVHLIGNAAYEERLLPVCRVRAVAKVVALTFDDGPDETYTPQVLSLLRRRDARATFFVIGRLAQALPDLVAAELAADMELANHGWSHVRLEGMTAAQAIDQADRMRAVLTEAGVTSRLFRPPFGEINPEQLSALRRSDYVPIHWSLAVDHYVGGLGMRPSVAAASLFEDLRSGDIILAHDAGTGSSRQRLERRRAVEALDLLLRELEVAGYRVVPVNELLNQGPGVKAKPREWFWQSGFECPRD